jgi:hypothetical protein
MGMYPSGAIPADITTGFTTGYLRVSGGGTFAKIEGITGPFKITLNYSSPTANNNRWPIVKFGTTEVNTDGSLGSTGTVYTANSGCVFTYNYTGTDTPSILLKVSSGGLIFHDVIIEKQQ